MSHPGMVAAELVARRNAECKRRAVGAVVYNTTDLLVSSGANRGPADQPSCLDGGCPRAHAEGVEPLSTRYDVGPGECIALHAEEEAMLRAGWDAMEGGTLVVTCQPCPNCWRVIRASPLARVVWPDGTWNRKQHQGAVT